VVSFVSGDQWSERAQEEVNSRIRNQVGLEFVNIDIERSLESERGSQLGYDLSDQSIQVGIVWSFDIQRLLSDAVNCFVIQHKSNIGVLQ